MKYFLIILSLCFGACVKTKNKACITYAEATQEDCVPTYSRLQEKEWILDSVVMNKKNITTHQLIPFGGVFKLFFNKKTFESPQSWLSFVDITDANSKQYDFSLDIHSKSSYLQSIPLHPSFEIDSSVIDKHLLGFYQPGTAASTICILNDKVLKIKLDSGSPDSVTYNYLSIH
jgi:hypothetical protein